MDYSELLHNLADGTLDSEQSELIYSVLSSNEELRSEFQELLAIRNAVQNDTVAFTPPVASTDKIFSTLGFSQAAAGGATTAAAGSALSGIVQKYGQWMFSGLVGAAVASTVFVAFNSQTADTQDATAHTARQLAQMRERVHSIPENAIEIPVTSSFSQPSAPAESVKYVYVRVPSPVDPTLLVANDNTTAADDQFDRPRDAHAIELLGAASALPTDINVANAYIEPLGAPTPTEFTQVDTEIGPYIDLSDRISFGIRGIASRAFPKANVETNAEAWLRNIAFDAIFELDERHAIGVEIGREAFYQKFTGEVNGEAGFYEQNPSLFWIGALYQYNHTDFGDIYPFGQLVLGGTLIGPHSRGLIGFKYAPESDVHMTFGVEGSVLYYQFQGNWFNTPKLGFTYGVTYNF